MTAENNRIFTHNKYSVPEDQTIWARHAQYHYAKRNSRVADFLQQIKTDSLKLKGRNTLRPNFDTIEETDL